MPFIISPPEGRAELDGLYPFKLTALTNPQGKEGLHLDTVRIIKMTPLWPYLLELQDISILYCYGNWL